MKSRLHFDPSISLGTILHGLAIVAAVAALYGRLVVLEAKVDTLWTRSETAIRILVERMNKTPWLPENHP
jgi:hypothetical protein